MRVLTDHDARSMDNPKAMACKESLAESQGHRGMGVVERTGGHAVLAEADRLDQLRRCRRLVASARGARHRTGRPPSSSRISMFSTSGISSSGCSLP